MGTIKSVGNFLEAAIVPTFVQKLYMHYKNVDTTLGETRIPSEFLTHLAQLAKHIYLTGTTRGGAGNDTKEAYALKYALGLQFQNYQMVERFSAATGMVFDTMGPFGAMIASVVLPNAESLPRTETLSPQLYRYRLYLTFRGTNPGLFYWDDISTDLKFIKRDSTIGNRRGDICSGFLTTYESCRDNILMNLIPKGIGYLNRQFAQIAAANEPTAITTGTGRAGNQPIPVRTTSSIGRPPQRPHPMLLSDSDIEIYITGHSLGGAVATLCAYDIACMRPGLNPVLVTFGSPPVGNIDFAVDFQKVMVDYNKFHPKSGFLRSVRIVARTKGDHSDIVPAVPDLLPNVLHINTRVKIASDIEGKMSMLGAHSMEGSYLKTLAGH